jgi:hypothetical protein
MSNILSAIEFNEMRNKEYADYCEKCIKNGVEPAKQSTYFPTIPVKYGFVRFNSFGEYAWKKRKKDFSY